MKTLVSTFSKWQLLIMILLFSYTTVQGQQTNHIGGHLINHQEEPVLYATVALIDATDSALVKGTLSSVDGTFKLENIQPGNYVLRISHVSYQTANKPVTFRGDSPYQTGTISLEEKSLQMDRLVVVGERIKAKEEGTKTTFFMNKKVTKASNTGLEALKHIPGVQVDFNQNLSLQGRENIIIEVDGKRRDMAYVRQLHPGEIEKIEVMDTPGAQYAGDVNGVINIRLKEPDEGFQGHVYGEAPTSGSEVYLLPNASLRYGRENWSVHASYQGDMKNFDIRESENRFFQFGGASNRIASMQDVRQKEWSHRFQYGVDYHPGPKDQISYFGYYNPFSHEFDGEVTFHARGQEMDNLYWSARKDEKDRNHKTWHSIHYKHRFNENQQLSAEGNYYRLSGVTINRYQTDSTTAAGISLPVSEVRPEKNMFLLKTEYAFSPDKWDLRLGARGALQNLTDRQREAFRYREQVLAGFLQAGYAASRWDLNMGLRAEQSFSELEDGFSNRDRVLLPHLAVSHQFSRSSRLRLSYRKSIYRPNAYQLNPVTTEPDPFSVESGNPGLQPELHHDLTLAYTATLGGHFLSTSAFFHQTQRAINRFTHINAAGLFETQTLNLGDVSQYGIQLKGAVRLGMISLNPYLRLYELQTRPNELAGTYQIKGQRHLEYDAGLSAMADFKHGLTAAFQLQYNSANHNIQGMTYDDPLYFFSVEKSFGKQFKVGIKSALPLDRSFTYLGSETSGMHFQDDSKGNIRMSGFPLWISLSYRFGSGKKIRAVEHNPKEMDQRDKKGF
jgi:outer membrane cobalamin receptor